MCLRFRGSSANKFFAQPVIDGFQDFDKKAQADIEAMPQAGAPISGEAAQKEVCTAFTAFVAAHQETLKHVIGKSGLLEGIFLGPVAAVLRQHENVLDVSKHSVERLVQVG